MTRKIQMKNISCFILFTIPLFFSSFIIPAHASGNVHFSGEIYGGSTASTNKCIDDAVYRMQAQRCAEAGEVPVVSMVRDVVPQGAHPMREVVIYSY